MAIPKYSAADWSSLGQLGIRAPGDYLMADVDPGTLSGPSLGNFNLSNPAGGGIGSAGPSFLEGLVGYTKGDGGRVQGWGGTALGAATGIMNGWMGLQQLNLAKDTLAQNKRQFELNYGAQKKTTNAALEDRQRARVASNSSAYQSVNDYMSKNGI